MGQNSEITAVDNAELRREVFKISKLTALPEVVIRLLEAVDKDDTSAASLEKIIESDQALTASVLRLANSAYYGCSQTITTIQRAIVVIGYSELRLLALGSSLSSFIDKSKQIPFFDGQDLWLHCLAVSWLARAFAEEARHENPEEAMISGLLHDVGKLTMVSWLDELTIRVSNLMNDGYKYYQAEEMVGIKHTTVGYWLTTKWGLPEIHTSTIRYHHDPDQCQNYHQTVCLVCLADSIAKSLSIGLSHEAPPVGIANIIRDAKIGTDQIVKVMKTAHRKLPSLIDSWSDIE